MRSHRIFSSFSTSLRLIVSIRLTPCSFVDAKPASLGTPAGGNSSPAPLRLLSPANPFHWASPGSAHTLRHRCGLPLLAIEGDPFPISSLFTQPTLLLGLLFLGVLGSALCYVCWNSAADTLGVLQTTMYIYAVPFVTMVSAALYLNETITAMGIGGAVLIVLGMVLSSKPAKAKAE